MHAWIVVGQCSIHIQVQHATAISHALHTAGIELLRIGYVDRTANSMFKYEENEADVTTFPGKKDCTWNCNNSVQLAKILFHCHYTLLWNSLLHSCIYNTFLVKFLNFLLVTVLTSAQRKRMTFVPDRFSVYRGHHFRGDVLQYVTLTRAYGTWLTVRMQVCAA